MTKFRSKPVEIEAIRLDTKLLDAIEAGEPPPNGLTVEDRGGFIWTSCRTRQGEVPANLDDWIIQESDGSGCYPCKPDVFAAKYEPI